MEFSDFPIGIINNPLTCSVYTDQTTDPTPVPGPSSLIMTEIFQLITTENNFALITE